MVDNWICEKNMLAKERIYIFTCKNCAKRAYVETLIKL